MQDFKMSYKEKENNKKNKDNKKLSKSWPLLQIQ
jgi:hypothetical protein